MAAFNRSTEDLRVKQQQQQQQQPSNYGRLRECRLGLSLKLSHTQK